MHFSTDKGHQILIIVIFKKIKELSQILLFTSILKTKYMKSILSAVQNKIKKQIINDTFFDII